MNATTNKKRGRWVHPPVMASTSLIRTTDSIEQAVRQLCLEGIGYGFGNDEEDASAAPPHARSPCSLAVDERRHHVFGHRRVFAQPAHRVGIPVGTKRHVDAQTVATRNQILPQALAHA
jgi:hypothetical protein